MDNWPWWRSALVCPSTFPIVFELVGFCLPDVGKRSRALEVNLGFWLVAGGLASVRIGGHAVETDLVAPEQEAKEER